MTRIDSSRIAEIFRSLASESAGQVRHNHNNAQHKPLAANPEKDSKSHDKDVLRQRLRQRLQRLSQEDIDFAEVAQEVTVKEVLIWEFGDQVMNHPEFNLLATKVTRAMRGNEKIAFHLQKLIRDMTGQT